MKKFTIIGLAICLAFALAAPAMAVDVDFSGHYYVRGSYVSQWDLRDTSESNAYMDMQFRLQTVFKASDILSVTTRFDALDERVWGTTADASAENNICWDRAYMTIKAPVGTFYVGRQAAGTFGTDFLDSGTNADRIVYKKVIDNLTVKALFEKVSELDNTLIGTSAGDADKDKYCLAAIQKMENLTVGVLGTFYDYKDSGSNANVGTTYEYTTRKYALTPYVVGKFGPLGIQGEVCYVWGKKDYDDASSTDLDYKTLAYNIEATYNFGPASIMAGYAFVSGDSGTADNEDSAAADGVGNDWGKLFILTTSDVAALVQLGDYGNLSKDGVNNGTVNKCGAKIIYGGATFSPLDNLTLSAVIGNAKADELTSDITKDNYGTEYDLTLNWKIYDNLTYTAIAAYLVAGDFFWDTTVDTKPTAYDDTYALFHQLQLSF